MLNLDTGVLTGWSATNAGSAPAAASLTGANGAVNVAVTTFSTSSTSLQFSWTNTSSFDNGQILVYGAK